jgi:EAL domain-containing protein (putative c-di-GMP-specific phosphodiesterase class I)
MDASSNLHCVNLERGARLFAEGEAAGEAYLIQRGAIEIFIERDGAERLLATRIAGEIVGEMGVIDGSPRSASARASQDSELLVVTAGQLNVRLSETDPILRMVLGVILKRYRETLRSLSGQADDAREDVDGSTFREAVETLTLEQELRVALKLGQLDLFYQPIVRMRDRKLAGFEALMRWRHPTRGLVQPGGFIGVAEASGLIVEMTAWALRRLLGVMPEIGLSNITNPHGTLPLFVSVNVSGRDLAQPGFAEGLAERLAEAGVDPNSVKLEVTESMLMRDAAHVADVLETCRRAGVGIALDDFGTGYSSLSHLGKFPISKLKIDMSFVRAMMHDDASRRIVQMILRLGEELAIPVVAEGIEDEQAANALADLGCAFGQGYFFGRPKPLIDTIDIIRHWTPAGSAPSAMKFLDAAG